MKKLYLAVMIAGVLQSALAMAQSPFDGTWKYDTRTMASGKRPIVLLLREGVFESKTAVAFKVKADGADHPGLQNDTLVAKVASDHEVSVRSKRDGRVINTATYTVSPNGNAMTVVSTVVLAQGTSPIRRTTQYVRVEAGPVGSHAISGSWRSVQFDSSDNGITWTFKVVGDELTMSKPTGISYTAKLNGPEAVMKGSSNFSLPSVAVKLLDKNKLQITQTMDGDVVGISTMTVAADGKILKEIYENKRSGTKSEYLALKQAPQDDFAGSAEGKVMAQYVGEWKNDSTERVTGKKSVGKQFNRWVLGGRWVEGSYRSSDRSDSALGMATYASDRKNYVAYFFYPDGTAWTYLGRWDADAHQMKWEGSSAQGIAKQTERFLDTNTVEGKGSAQDRDGKTVKQWVERDTRDREGGSVKGADGNKRGGNRSEQVASKQAPQDDFAQSAEGKVLARLVGRWHGEYTYTLPTKSRTSAETVTKSVLDGRWLRSSSTESDGLEQLALLTYDASEKAYVLFLAGSDGGSDTITGQWNEQARRLTWTKPTGKTGKGTMTFIWSFPDDKTMKSTVRGTDDDGKLIFEHEGKDTRVQD
ncbi:MAG TPA: DUF1579 family protein [Tepidisphaeraceae bacterium]|nr:DUF1579 family protein [Tepidisphaeraceae bacterium]